MSNLDQILSNMEPRLVETLKAWVKIPSVLGKAEPGAPFGKDLRVMLDRALSDCAALDFDTADFGGYIGHAEFGEGNDEDALAILAHLDVVPVGDGWTMDPFGGEVRDGRIYARGASDDKGPAVAALYAMAAVKQAGIPLKRKVRLILGCDEESGMKDIAHYQKVTVMPRSGFSPDATYPVINIEKGLYVLTLKGKPDNEGLRVLRFVTGERRNVVPGMAQAGVEGDEALAQRALAIAASYGWPATAHAENGQVHLQTTGINGHAAFPHLARNAIGQMLIILRDLGATGAWKQLADAIGTEYHGEHLGIAVEDGASGKLTCNLGIIQYEGDDIVATLDIRYPLLANPTLLPILARQQLPGFVVTGQDSKGPHFVPKDSSLVQALLDAYHEVTGLERKAIAIGGGTYARALREGVAFGALFPGEKDIAHQADEYASLESLYKSMRIFAHAIVKLAAKED
ncbi:MAG: M20 family metallopeptidase [Clostridiales bacterium]|nr:M20 family metallopeptidase [Clostridiales bacterium]